MGKSAATRAKISDIALASFRERGFEQTTLRLIAAEAGVSVGNAYYYFPTKNHLVQELYVRIQESHWERASAALEGETDIARRLEIALMTGIDGIDPYHSTAPGFLAAAIGPTSAVSPFGADAAVPRELAIRIFESVVSGSTNAIPAKLKAQLPELLWLAYMGITLFWVYDSSDGQARTRSITKRAVKLFGQMLPLARLPFLKGPIADLLGLFLEARPVLFPATNSEAAR